MQPLSQDRGSKLKVSRDVFFQEINGEIVLLNLRDGMYYGLDPVGFRMWQLLCQHRDPEKVVPILLQEYNVSEEQLRRDLYDLIAKLCNAGLLERCETETT